MDDKELLELQQKADSGDAVECVRYIREVFERINVDGSKNEDDYRIVWEYTQKLATVRSEMLKEEAVYFYKNIYKFYKKAKEYNPNLSYDPYPEEKVKYLYYLLNGGYSKLCKSKEMREILIFLFGFFKDKYEEHSKPAINIFNDVIKYHEETPHSSLKGLYYYDAAEAAYLLSKLCPEERIKHLEYASNNRSKAATEELVNYYIENKNFQNAKRVAENFKDDFFKKNEYSRFIEGLEFYENGEYQRAITAWQENSSFLFKAYPYLGHIFFENLAGNSFDIKQAKRYGKYCDIDYLEIAEKQEKFDISMSGLPDEVAIPELETALRNANCIFYYLLNDLSKSEVDKETKEFLNSVKIFFSYEEKKTVYVPTLEDIKDLLDKLGKFSDVDEGVKVFIEEMRNNLLPFDCKVLSEIFQKLTPGLSHIAEKIPALNNLLRTLEDSLSIHEFITRGAYRESDNTIIIYLLNIYNLCKDKGFDRNEPYLLGVYFHELFHAFHLYNARENDSIRCSKESEQDIVLESLASYFQYLSLIYCFKNNNNGKGYLEAMNIQSSWDIDMFVYPYAGAKLIDGFQQGFRSNSLFNRVLKRSFVSFREAFSLLKLIYDMANE